MMPAPELEFLRPAAFLLLPLPWLFLRWSRRIEVDAGVTLPERVLAFLQGRHDAAAQSARRNLLRNLLAWLGWIALVVALSGPLSGKTALPGATGRDLLVVLDLSASMRAVDARLDNQTVSRVEAVKKLAGSFIRGRDGDRIGLIVFANQPFLIAPLTYDVAAVSRYLDEVAVGLPGRKTAVGDAIALGVAQLQATGGASRVMLVLTDGVSNTGVNTPAQAAGMAQRNQIRIHTIGFGGQTPGSPGESDTELRQIAATTGGQYFPAPSAQALRSVYAMLDKLEPTQSAHATRFIHRELSPYALVLALAAACALTWLDWRTARL